MDTEVFYRINQVIERVGLSRSTIYALIQRGEFPAPLKITRKAAVWPSSHITAWQQERIKAA